MQKAQHLVEFYQSHGCPVSCAFKLDKDDSRDHLPPEVSD